MRKPIDELPIWELRLRIEREIAAVRFQYAALMPPMADEPAKRMPWWPGAATRPFTAGVAELAVLNAMAPSRPQAAVSGRPA